MEFITINSQDFMQTKTDQSHLATVSGNMFGGIVVNAHDGQATSFSGSVGYLGLTNIRFPGGQLSETGSIVKAAEGIVTTNIDGADQSGWSTGELSASNYAYDLRYPDLINPALLAADTDIMSFSQAIALAKANNCSIEMILPTVRYSDFQNSLSGSQVADLLDRSRSDVSTFLQNLFVAHSYGAPPSEVILDIGNENLVWTTKFPETQLETGQSFDPKAVQWGLALYCDVARKMLEAAADFRELYPDANFKMAIQVPYMNDKAGTSDPVDVFLTELRAMPASELAQIDIIRFHPLDYSMKYAADMENWMTANLVKYASVINAARAEMGDSSVVQFSADAHSQTGKDDGGVGDGMPAQSLQAAAATVAAMSSLIEMGVDYASAWGIAINYREDVQASYYDPATGATHYTPRGEVLRQMAETLPGMTLVNTQQFVDAGRTGPLNLQAFGDGSNQVLFVSANNINDGDSGETTSGQEVTINLAGLAHPVTYAWVETITTADGNGGEAVVWNPLRDGASQEWGETWVTVSGNSVTFHFSQDYEMIRLIVSTGPFGSGPQILIGDAQRGLGIVNDHLSTGAGADYVQGLSGSDTISGGAGDDRLYGDRAEGAGLDGGDLIQGGAGNDALYGGSGNDTLDGDGGGDSIYGGDGNDVIYFDSGLDLVSGGDGFDTLILLQTGSGTTARGLAFGVDSISILGFERIVGSNSSDNITGDTLANILGGSGGNDYLSGWAGNDLLFGGLGDDKIWGGGGNDRVFGNGGRDSLSGGLGDDIIEGGLGIDTLIGGRGNDDFRFSFQANSGDAIRDFGASTGNDDRISLDASNFSLHLATGRLADRNFYLSTDTLDHGADQFVIFRASDKTLWVDTNGSAEGGLVVVATLQSTSFDLQASDIFLF